MKPFRLILAVTALSLSISLVASAACAGERQDVETRLVAEAQSGVEHMTAALDAFKAGDDKNGCANLHQARDDMTTALDLVAQDQALVKIDGDSSEAQRDKDLADLNTMHDQFSSMRDRMDVQLEKRCS